MKRKSIFFAAFLSLALLLSCLSGCGAKSYAGNSSMAISETVTFNKTEGAFEMDAAENFEMEAAEEDFENSGSGETLNETVLEASVERKLTYRADVEMETKEYRSTLDTLEDRIAALNGYIAHSSVSDYGDDSDRTYARYAYFEVQIPAESLDSFLEELKEIGNVLNISKQVEDITTSYYNTQSRLESLKQEEERLIEMQEAADTLEELLTIEGYLSDVRSEINYLHSMMQVYEKQVSYSTVNIQLNEVVDYTETPVQNPTFGERIAGAFFDSLDFFAEAGQGLILVLVFLAPLLLILAVLAVAIVLCVKLTSKKRARRKAERRAQAQSPVAPEQPNHEPK